MKHYNFSSGPATLPHEVMTQVQQEFHNVLDTNLSIVEISHRSDAFLHILEKAKQDLRTLLSLHESTHILFLAGGASMQFEMLPLNFSNKGDTVDYIETGYWSKKAIAQAKILGRNVHIAGSCAASKFCELPNHLNFSHTAKYTHLVYNETIDGLELFRLPKTTAPLVIDASSNILSRPMDTTHIAMMYAGCQKNIAPAGMTLVIIQDQFLQKANTHLTQMLSYHTYAEHNSLYNTPPVFSIYFAGKVFEHLIEQGGLEAVEKQNQRKAKKFYHYLDQQDFYYNLVASNCRSNINIPFYMRISGLEQQFTEQAQSQGLHNLSGHRSKGGLRASLYNAMPIEGVDALLNFMEDFRKKHEQKN